MNGFLRLGVLLSFVLSISGCEFRPFEPTGARETTPVPRAAVTCPPTLVVETPPPILLETLAITYTVTFTPSIIISPTVATWGDEMGFVGGGFSPGGGVHILLASPNQTIYLDELVADEQGNFSDRSFRFPIPEPVGEWEVLAIDEMTGISATQKFDVSRPTPPENFIHFEGTSVKLGERIPFSAIGFKSGEKLKLKITRSDGSIVEYDSQADKEGSLIGTISVETNRPLGLYQVEIDGQEHGHKATGWINVGLSTITIKDQNGGPVCTTIPIHLGDLTKTQVKEIYSFAAYPKGIMTVSRDPKYNNVLLVHCLVTPQSAIVVVTFEIVNASRTAPRIILTVGFRVNC